MGPKELRQTERGASRSLDKLIGENRIALNVIPDGAHSAWLEALQQQYQHNSGGVLKKPSHSVCASQQERSEFFVSLKQST